VLEACGCTTAVAMVGCPISVVEVGAAVLLVVCRSCSTSGEHR
jgi:hypothetical protein